MDLFYIYNKHLQNPKNIFNNLVIDSEKKLDIEDSSGIQTNINTIKELPLNDFNSYEKLYIKNYMTLLESTYIDVEYNDRREAINVLLKFLKSQIYGFKVNNYKNFNYSPIEERILMNLSAMGYNLYKNETSFEISSHLLDISHRDDIVYPKLFLNLSTIYHYKSNYKKSLDLSQEGIQYCLKNSNKDILSKLFFRKFTSELNLGIDNYKNSLNKAILLAEINNNDYLENIFINSAEKFYNVSYDKNNLY